jgi:signal transduction histidine kinase
MRRITHELKGPLTVFRGASKYALKEMAENGWVFSQDYLQQMRSYITLMEQIVAKAGFLRVESGLKLQRRRVLLFDDIIMPVIFGLEDYLNDRGFSKSNIDVDRVRDTRHALFLDKLRFQQVIFNLLSNSVKYAFRDPELFKVTITAKEFGGLIVLTFSDWGTGIPMGMDESIFREGVRGPNADELDAAGEGLGLWLVREIIRAHEGRITVTSPRNPTEFTVTLPTSVKVPIFHGNSDNKGM